MPSILRLQSQRVLISPSLSTETSIPFSPNNQGRVLEATHVLDSSHLYERSVSTPADGQLHTVVKDIAIGTSFRTQSVEAFPL